MANYDVQNNYLNSSLKLIVPSLTLAVACLSLLFFLFFFNHRALHSNYIKINGGNISMLNGNFEITPYRTYNTEGVVHGIYDSLNKHNIVSILSDRENDQVIEEEAIMNIHFIGKTKVAVSFLTLSEELYYKEYEGRFKRNGFFYFDKTMSSQIGIPLIAGGSYKYRSRLGLTKHGSLIVQTAESNMGSLLFIFWKGYREHLVYHFRRIISDIKV